MFKEFCEFKEFEAWRAWMASRSWRVPPPALPQYGGYFGRRAPTYGPPPPPGPHPVDDEASEEEADGCGGNWMCRPFCQCGYLVGKNAK